LKRDGAILHRPDAAAWWRTNARENVTAMESQVLVYGAYGYTGTLIVRELLAQGVRPVLAGRSAPPLHALARAHELEARVFALEEPAAVDAGLEGVQVAVHCAGPFSRTADAMAEACLRTGTHYLDITGELGVFETMAARDQRARAAGVLLMPGAGFDVVPSDCLALHLKQRLPEATHLTLGIHSHGRPSHGTLATVLENFGHGGMVRQDGRLVCVPTAWKQRQLDFGKFTQTGITIPWGDVATAFYSTGIPNIEVYMSAPRKVRMAARASRYLGWLLRREGVQGVLRRRIPAGGPDADERARSFCLLWGEVRDKDGQTAEAHLRTPDGYDTTARAAVLIARKVLAGNAPPGYQTPAMAYGSDLVLHIEGVQGFEDCRGTETPGRT